MSELSISVKQNARFHGESDPLMLASSVEQARRQLLKTMLENKDIAKYVAKQLVTELKKGGDGSEIVL